MSTDMIPGYIYFIESDAGDNQNWVHTVDDIDLATNYSGQEGNEYVKLEIPEQLKIGFKTGIIVVDSGGGRSYDERTNRRAFQALAKGIETSRTNAATVRNFFMLDRHTSGASAIFKRYYMIVKYGTTTYEKFIDATSTSRDYCKGVVIDGNTTWNKDEPLIATIKLNWRSVW